MDFLIMDYISSYNSILTRPFSYRVRVVTLTYHLALKFPTDMETGIV